MRAAVIGAQITGLVAAVLAAPAMAAEPSTTTPPNSTPPPAGEGSVHITADGSPQAGEDIGVVVRCNGKTGQPSSPVLDIGELQQVESPADIPTYRAPATIETSTLPGKYPLTAPCGDATLRWTFKVYPSGSPGQVSITADGSPQAGEDIGVVVRCYGGVGRPSSPVLDIGELSEIETPAHIPTYRAPATIEPGTEPGEYPVSAPCAGHTLTSTFTVYPAASESTEPSHPDTEERQVVRVPSGAPETGGGPVQHADHR